MIDQFRGDEQRRLQKLPLNSFLAYESHNLVTILSVLNSENVKKH